MTKHRASVNKRKVLLKLLGMAREANDKLYCDLTPHNSGCENLRNWSDRLDAAFSLADWLIKNPIARMSLWEHIVRFYTGKEQMLPITRKTVKYLYSDDFSRDVKLFLSWEVIDEKNIDTHSVFTPLLQYIDAYIHKSTV